MNTMDVTPTEKPEPDWFREPTRREHFIAAGLFIAFGLFFATWFFVLSGWWFRWVIIALAIFSILHGVRHVQDARRMKRKE